ncbi:HpcH/HpaI aldolase/citrate lyase family protein [Chloroflexota bacterium]
MGKNKTLRSMLFVPANSWRMISTAKDEGADAVILDLEDGCPIGEKETGRIFARDCVPMLRESDVDVFVRINPFETNMAEEDLHYVVAPGLDGIILPKAEVRDDITKLDHLLSDEENKKGIDRNSIAILPLLENPKGILGASDIIAASQRIIGVSIGMGDYSREIGVGMGVTSLSTDDNYLMSFYPRCTVAMAARAAGVLAIDSPFFGLIIDTEKLADDSYKAKLLGFTGRLITHPRHTDPVNQVFSPSKEDVDSAKQVIETYEEARTKGMGATTIGGRMIDYGSYRRAISVMAMHDSITKKRKVHL